MESGQLPRYCRTLPKPFVFHKYEWQSRRAIDTYYYI